MKHLDNLYYRVFLDDYIKTKKGIIVMILRALTSLMLCVSVIMFLYAIVSWSLGMFKLSIQIFLPAFMLHILWSIIMMHDVDLYFSRDL